MKSTIIRVFSGLGRLNYLKSDTCNPDLENIIFSILKNDKKVSGI